MSDRPQRVLVTGCAGFIGSTLAERLVRSGVEVVGVDCFTDYYPRFMKEGNLSRLLENPRFELQELDLSRDSLDELLAGVDTVFHLAAQAGVRNSFGEFEAYARNNLQATQRLLEAITADPVDAFVYASSSSIYGDALSYPTSETITPLPVSPYGLTKLATEQIVDVYHRSHGIRAVGLRYFTVYGPRQRPDMAFSRFIAAAEAGQPIGILGDGSQRRDFTFVDDVVEGTLAAARRGRAGAVYNIGGGSPTEIGSVVSTLGELLEREITVEYLPRARGDARHTNADCSLARSELGFEPQTGLRDGIARQVEWTLAAGRMRAAELY